ncbi:hypothetical protein KGF57_002744 [Candida theae]|uniref:Ketoreductase (KR) domain-containing protein n=1 Tax=Candida theae TaxID=1198502 RepID=A0AAD5BEE3_9ASCO|nr:uncharacterized protein KGF57_002744 [Candida theae]KAI5957936.1 hypothetical protein KGF57_002744 [Candida theae]
MPVEFLASVLFDGPQVIPYWEQIKQYGPTLIPIATTVALGKYYFRGATNTWERDLHGKVYMITGGTSGIGAVIAHELAMKGAQLIILTRRTDDSWVAEYIDDLRDQTSNPLIYAEQCDLNSLYSVRKFATKWLDNATPRRLDGVICCAAEAIPRNIPRQITVDGVEKQMGINYLGHFHLLTLLEPSLKSQPPDRDVRVLIATCSSQSLGEIDLQDLLWEQKQYPTSQPWKVYGSSKLLLGVFAKQYQKRLMEYERKDKAPCNIRINLVNPGLVRTPSTRRFISMGTIWGLLLYLITFPVWWLFLKSVYQGAQTFYFGLYAPVLMKMEGGCLLQECKIMTKIRKEIDDKELQEKVYHNTTELIKKLEVQSAIERKKNKTEEEIQQEKEAELKRKRDVNIQPKTTEELNQKLNTLRSQIGIGGGSSVSNNENGMPLFPEESDLENLKNNSSSKNRTDGKKSSKKKSKGKK